MRNFSLLVKPAGSACNLDCPYCFYRGHGPSARMTEETLDRVLTSYSALPLASHDVAFQGGEPLLMDERFFRRAASVVPNVNFSVQTNATRVTPALAKFFAKANWLVGVSPHWRDEAAESEGGAEKSEGEAGYRRLVEAGAAVNVLQLVTARNVGEPEKLYRYIRDDLGSTWHQYIECTDPKPYAITGEEWGEFLCRLFDVWRGDDDVRRVSVRLFDSIVSELVEGRPTMCNFTHDCRNYLVIEANGDVYPCDFHVQPEYRLGNALTDSWEALLASPVYEAFGLRKRNYADCPRNRRELDVGWRRFFSHALPFFKELAGELKGGR